MILHHNYCEAEIQRLTAELAAHRAVLVELVLIEDMKLCCAEISSMDSVYLPEVLKTERQTIVDNLPRCERLAWAAARALVKP